MIDGLMHQISRCSIDENLTWVNHIDSVCNYLLTKCVVTEKQCQNDVKLCFLLANGKLKTEIAKSF